MGERPLKKLLWWCNHLLRLASWIVPRGQRVEWLREWEGEVWHWGSFSYGVWAAERAHRERATATLLGSIRGRHMAPFQSRYSAQFRS